jgi:competence protein ComEC
MILEQSILVLNKGLALIEFAPFSGISKIWITPLEDFLLYLIIIGIFYFIYNRKIWVVKASLFITLIFCLFISFKRLTVQNSSTIAFLNVRSHTAIIFKNRTQATVVTDLADTDKLYRYSVQPFLDSCKVDKPAKVGLKQDLQNGYLRKSGNIIVFGNERLLIFDKALQGINLRPKFETNYIFITGNPQTDVPRINKNFSYGQMIVDANNANALVTKLKAQAQSLKIKCTVLKRNKSLLLVSN